WIAEQLRFVLMHLLGHMDVRNSTAPGRNGGASSEHRSRSPRPPLRTCERTSSVRSRAKWRRETFGLPCARRPVHAETAENSPRRRWKGSHSRECFSCGEPYVHRCESVPDGEGRGTIREVLPG